MMVDVDAPSMLRFTGALADLSTADRARLLDRSASVDNALRARTAELIARVQRDGDDALLALARELDGVTLSALEVPRDRWTVALDALDPALRGALQRAADNIARVHRAFLPHTMETSPEPGVVIGRRPEPLARVGVYAPGGRATYPSSVLMGAVPARVAGVGEVILCSPPGRDGLPSGALLAAAKLAGVDRVFAIGGAGAIAALAYGTATVPHVDRIVGPGNAYVAEAKLQVAGIVGIDAPAGPSEILVIGGPHCDPTLVAREMLAQAEHDERAAAVALLVGRRVTSHVRRELAAQIAGEPRRAIITEALAVRGAVLDVESVDEALVFANQYAPEHLLLLLDDAECAYALPKLRTTGTIFAGTGASNALGDYMTGANHVLPTGGRARSFSGLSVSDFMRITTYQRVDATAAARLAGDVAVFAEAEGLPGHARAARAWHTAASRTAGASSPLASSSPCTRASAVTRLARPDILALAPFAAGGPDGRQLIDVSDNTNLWGAPPAALRALREAPPESSARYPLARSQRLKQRLLAYVGLPDADVVTGCGSDDVLDAAMRAFGSPGDVVAASTPTFSMIPRFARLNGLRFAEVPLRDAETAYDIDAERLVATGASIVYVCAPNNPTGTTVSRDALEYVVSHAPGIVILDEAYVEFASTSYVNLVRRSERLLVSRTLSKAFGLAGLRVGYAVGAPELVSAVDRALGPYKVTTLGERAALAALQEGDEGLDWVRVHAALARSVRTRMTAALTSLGLAPLPSDGNFLLIPARGAEMLARTLRVRGVAVRALVGLPRDLRALAATDGEALRMGIGPWEVMQHVLVALAEVLA
ncbi:MAG TPA: histidinol dehydrogenase [Gemmatimonadaceae bacterium]|nr:histidinol dehydrogenase [Gemmatimonadaceae bacterium]